MAVTDEELRKIYRFDEFQIDARKRVLRRDGQALTLKSKAFDLLLALVTSGGRELSKDELMESVWRDQIVEENNLAVHIYNLRKILGERKDEHRYIITIPGVGYRFVADVNEAASESEELYIESHTLSRIVVEEGDSSQIIADGVNATTALVPLSKGETVNGDGLYSTAQAATATAIAPLVQSRTRKLVLLAALVGLLTIGVGGYWLRNRLQASVVPAPAPRRQMTITRLTDGRVVAAPSISPDGKFIAYGEHFHAGAGSLFLQQTDADTVRQLLDPADRRFGCNSFSPDGTLIYFAAFDKGSPRATLYSVPVLGGTPKRLIVNFPLCFSLSPDGERVAFFRAGDEGGRRRLMTATLDGSDERTLLTARDELVLGSFLAWSPDGSLIAFSADGDPDDLGPNRTIFGVDVSGGATTKLAAESFSELGRMSWTSDGRSLVFVAKRPRSDNQLYLMDYPSGEVRPITNDMESYGHYGLSVTADGGALVAGVWEKPTQIWQVGSDGDATKAVQVGGGKTNGRLGITALPDGRVAYVARTGGNSDIWTVKEDGTDARALTEDSFIQSDAAASPDGRYIVFSSDRGGGSHLFRMNADDGSEMTQLTFGSTFDTQPDVSPDGRWVTYASSNGKQSTVWKVPLAGGDAVRLTDYESNAPVFAPDGNTIAFLQLVDSRAKLRKIAVISVEGVPVRSFQPVAFPHGCYTIRWTPDGKAVVFIEARKGIFNLWQHPVSGDPPRQLTNFPSGTIWNFAYSLDGKRILLARGNTFVDVVLIKNFRS